MKTPLQLQKLRLYVFYYVFPQSQKDILLFVYLYAYFIIHDSSQAPGTPVRLMKGLKILKNIKNNKVVAVCNSEKKAKRIF